MRTIKVDGYDVVECCGIKISTALFKWFALDAEAGSLFRFVKRQGGLVTVARVHDTNRNVR